mmetsp:Transcript_116704/g.364820  ORF Transcript_116704/g.364820 Transcript_116704/m.364820 type:complete len:204 (-) Transcript_116704:178-789(-)
MLSFRARLPWLASSTTSRCASTAHVVARWMPFMPWTCRRARSCATSLHASSSMSTLMIAERPASAGWASPSWRSSRRSCRACAAATGRTRPRSGAQAGSRVPRPFFWPRRRGSGTSSVPRGGPRSCSGRSTRRSASAWRTSGGGSSRCSSARCPTSSGTSPAGSWPPTCSLWTPARTRSSATAAQRSAPGSTSPTAAGARAAP